MRCAPPHAHDVQQGRLQRHPIRLSGGPLRWDRAPLARQRTAGGHLGLWRGTHQRHGIESRAGDRPSRRPRHPRRHVRQHPNSRATLERFSGNMFKGFLTTDQAANAVSFVEIRLGDDSPEDGEGGAILFAENAILEDVTGHTWESTQVGYTPVRTGGQLRDGFPVADGNERMTLRYNLETLAAARIVQAMASPPYRPPRSTPSPRCASKWCWPTTTESRSPRTARPT